MTDQFLQINVSLYIFHIRHILIPIRNLLQIAINSEPKAVLRLSVKYKPTSVFSLQNLDKITFHIDIDVVAVF